MVQTKNRRIGVNNNSATKYMRIIASIICVGLMMVVTEVLAAKHGGGGGGGNNITLGTMASNVTDTFDAIGKLITGGSYIAGLGFSIGAIMKFKQHKDNPTQIPIGTPIALILIAAALLFLPSILSVAGYTMFGSSGGQTAGPSGITYSGA
ncbi:type IV secretion protein IcmD [Legionella dresdenensis]|uniref:Type IV secretion protein IcmD n=1 Tax=Legionella dresdenensis TaxID=450200 RepID=A0ABV8CEV6_9GAMM